MVYFRPDNHPGLMSSVEEKAKAFAWRERMLQRRSRPMPIPTLAVPPRSTLTAQDREKLTENQHKLLEALRRRKRMDVHALMAVAGSEATRRFRELRAMGYPVDAERVSGTKWVYFIKETK